MYKKLNNTSQMFSYVDERVSEPYRQAYGDTQKHTHKKGLETLV